MQQGTPAKSRMKKGRRNEPKKDRLPRLLIPVLDPGFQRVEFRHHDLMMSVDHRYNLVPLGVPALTFLFSHLLVVAGVLFQQ